MAENPEFREPGSHDHPPQTGMAGGLSGTEDWRRIFASYSHVVLVANSDAVDIGELQKEFPATALFVFFNKVYKVLDRPFDGNALLISRAGPKGANIVYRREVADVVRFFPPDNFLGIMNVRVNQEEKLNCAADYGGTPTGHLDLAGFCGEFYPEAKVPTTGFAMALWLSELELPGQIVLAGFTARRSEKWKVVSVHDWTFEQVFLRLFVQSGKLSIHGGIPESAYIELANRFPDISRADISMVAADVLSERLGNAQADIDKLISLTNIIRATDNFFRRLKPRFLKRK